MTRGLRRSSQVDLSLENILRPKVQMLRDQGFAGSQIINILSSSPVLLSLSAKRIAYRMQVLDARGFLTERSLGYFMKLTDAQFAARFA
mmetsp:Transcript_51099/g.165397  ORF Transcript_51099/g.165397 Transcript_51099/m.165397 type:complete len:89 (+) Transcript_51099:64-330(+)